MFDYLIEIHQNYMFIISLLIFFKFFVNNITLFDAWICFEFQLIENKQIFWKKYCDLQI